MAGLFSTGVADTRLNRVHDFMDIFELARALPLKTGERHDPAALGVHAQVTEFVNLGAVHFTGYSAEMDGRGLFAGFESVLVLAVCLCRSCVSIRITRRRENYFKKADTLWDRRMQSTPMRFWNKPAKELHYKSVSDWLRRGSPLFYRGWQYWGNTGVEVALCEPFLTHLGF